MAVKASAATGRVRRENHLPPAKAAAVSASMMTACPTKPTVDQTAATNALAAARVTSAPRPKRTCWAEVLEVGKLV